jgi:hypothetical protein
MIGGPTAAQNPDGCHWLAVYASSGALLFRSTCEQWGHDPIGEMTRFADAATAGRPPRIGLPLIRCRGESLDYGAECAAPIPATGQVVRWSAAPKPCDYVRITGCDGHELVYWTADEWRAEPEEVIGALLGACCAGAQRPPASRSRRLSPRRRQRRPH